MDPGSALQLTTTIIGIIDYGVNVFSDAREILQSGQTSRHAELSKVVGSLHELSTELQYRLKDDSESQIAPSSDNRLLILSQRCIEVSDKLQSALCKIHSDTTSHSNAVVAGVGSIIAAFKTSWKSSGIDGLKADLVEIRSQMAIEMMWYFL